MVRSSLVTFGTKTVLAYSVNVCCFNDFTRLKSTESSRNFPSTYSGIVRMTFASLASVDSISFLSVVHTPSVSVVLLATKSSAVTDIFKQSSKPVFIYPSQVSEVRLALFLWLKKISKCPSLVSVAMASSEKILTSFFKDFFSLSDLEGCAE